MKKKTKPKPKMTKQKWELGRKWLKKHIKQAQFESQGEYPGDEKKTAAHKAEAEIGVELLKELLDMWLPRKPK